MQKKITHSEALNLLNQGYTIHLRAYEGRKSRSNPACFTPINKGYFRAEETDESILRFFAEQVPGGHIEFWEDAQPPTMKLWKLGYGCGFLGSGLAIWRKDNYRDTGHISDAGTVSLYDKTLTEEVKQTIEELKTEHVSQVKAKMMEPYLQTAKDLIIGDYFPLADIRFSQPKEATEEAINELAELLFLKAFHRVDIREKLEILIFNEPIKSKTAYADCYFGAAFPFFYENEEILKRAQRNYNNLKGIQTGDFIEIAEGEYTRVTYVWRDENAKVLQIQTGGVAGHYGYHLYNSGTMSYSGTLDTGYTPEQIADKPHARKNGTVWFFSNGDVKPHNAVYLELSCRVWKLLKP